MEGSLLDMVIEAELPLRIVEHPAFVRFVKDLNGRFAIPNR